MPFATLLVTPRQQALELCWSLVRASVFAALGAGLWGLVRGYFEQNVPWSESLPPLVSLFFITLMASWIVLVPGKLWTEKRGDSWARRLVMLGLGGLLGLFACWLDGWSPGQTWRLEEVSQSGVHLFPRGISVEATYVSFYALAFFVLRWWRMTSRRRSVRFSFAPLLGAGFWAAVLWLLLRPAHLPGSYLVIVVLILTAAIVQLVSPWEQPSPPPARRVRTRQA
jgi:hypothetical protein